MENIDLVCKRTGRKRIGFVGHGHGATEMLIALSFFAKEVEDRLTSVIALAPIGHSTHTSNPFYDYFSRYWRSF